MGRKIMSAEQKTRVFSQLIQHPQGRAVIGQTIDKNVAFSSNTGMRTSLYAGNSEYSSDNQQGRIGISCSLFPSETTRGASVMDDDIVRPLQRCREVSGNTYPPTDKLVSNHLYDESNRVVRALTCKVEGLGKSDCMLENGVKALGTGEDTSKNLKDVPAISRKLQNIKKYGIPGEDFVTCAICGFKCKDLNTHINRVHKLSCSEYRKEYPGRKIVADEAVCRRVETSSVSVKKFFQSEVGEQVLKDASEKRVRTNLQRYGVVSPNTKKMWPAIKLLRETEPTFEQRNVEQFQKTCMERYGVDNVMDVPEFREKAVKNLQETMMENHGVLNAGQIPYIQEKIRKAQHITPNKCELYLLQFLPDFVKFVGDGSFWVMLGDGKSKNPDFVVRPFRKWRSVIELFGEHVHSPEEEAFVIDLYKSAGVRCLVIWCKELSSKKRRDKMCEKITNFLTLYDEGSSETIRQTPDKVKI
ncbi:MAG: hypothetical protein WC981_03380 [Candidatus Dojkabacteria bacterium]